MKIQLLTFPGCPHADLARNRLRAVLADAGLAFEDIDTQADQCLPELRQHGSPTILVNGIDIEDASVASGSSCRLYADGAPSESAIRAAIMAAD